MEYELRVEGVLDKQWTDWFDGLEIEVRGSKTVLHGRVRDQAALHSILGKIRDLGLTLVSLSRREDAQ